MITLAALIVIWFIVSVIRVKRACKGEAFNPIEADSIVDYIGFILGGAVFLAVVIGLCFAFLP